MHYRARWIIGALVILGLDLAVLPAMAVKPQLADAAALPEPPRVLFKDLFVAVQTGKVFPDSKTFADAIPKSSPSEILARFLVPGKESA